MTSLWNLQLLDAFGEILFNGYVIRPSKLYKSFWWLPQPLVTPFVKAVLVSIQSKHLYLGDIPYLAYKHHHFTNIAILNFTVYLTMAWVILFWSLISTFPCTSHCMDLWILDKVVLFQFLTWSYIDTAKAGPIFVEIFVPRWLSIFSYVRTTLSQSWPCWSTPSTSQLLESSSSDPSSQLWHEHHLLWIHEFEVKLLFPDFSSELTHTLTKSTRFVETWPNRNTSLVGSWLRLHLTFSLPTRVYDSSLTAFVYHLCSSH